jgi:hypothetical protein
LEQKKERKCPQEERQLQKVLKSKVQEEEFEEDMTRRTRGSGILQKSWRKLGMTHRMW